VPEQVPDDVPDGVTTDEAVRRIEQELIVLIRRVRRNVTTRAQALHPDLHAGGYAVLLCVAEHGTPRAKDLAEILDVDKAVVSRQVAHLEALGLVARTSDPADGRAQLVALTDDGRARLDALRAREQVEFRRRLSGWPPEDLAGFAGLLSRYNTVFEK
jgi:DNA-binding MarR family transcriptional regulator